MSASEEMGKLYKAYQSRINYIPGPFAGGGGVGREENSLPINCPQGHCRFLAPKQEQKVMTWGDQDKG